MTAVAALDTGLDWSADRIIGDAGRLLGDHRPADALRLLTDAPASTHDLPLLHHLTGRAQAGLNNPLAALTAFRKAAERGGASADLFNDMGNSLAWLGKLGPAADAYRLAIRLQPNAAPLYLNLGNALSAAGDLAGAARAFAECATQCPSDPVARHMLAALTGGPPPDRAADGYVAANFDNFAASFDATLVGKLGYEGPALIRAAMDRQLGRPEGQLYVLDAGCGTGLCAPLLRPFAAQLDGVDLSAEMLVHAQARQAYDRLDRVELGAHLAAHPAHWDAIVAADVFSYFGNLAEPFRAAKLALRPGGALFATVESDEQAAAGFVLRPSGRYAHTEAFVAACARDAGLYLVHYEIRTLRHERGLPVPAMVFILAAEAPGHAEEHHQ